MDKPSPLEVPIEIGLSVDPTVEEINEALDQLGWCVAERLDKTPTKYKANLGPSIDPARDPSDPQHEYWHTATVTVELIDIGTGLLRIVPNKPKSGIETTFETIRDAILSRLERVGISNRSLPIKPNAGSASCRSPLSLV